MNRIILSIFTVSSISFGTIAQNVTIPDANFKAYLVSNMAINTNMDGEIQVSEANSFSGSILCNSLSISDLTGIEAFTGLTELRCHANSLTSLNVTQNTALTYLSCYGNNISLLDVSQNTGLTVLSCHTNNLTALDVTQNSALTVVSCSNNSIVSLDLSQNGFLETIVCLNNALTYLNVANGNNINVNQFTATGNPNLTCITVDDANYSTINWTNIDASASFDENCSLGIDGLTSGNYFSIYPNPSSTYVSINSKVQIEIIEIYNCMGELIKTVNTSSFSVSELPIGTYVFKVKTISGIINERFIKI